MLKADTETKALQQWGLKLDSNPIKFGARIMTPENIELGPVSQAGDARRFQYQVTDADWTNNLKDGKQS